VLVTSFSLIGPQNGISDGGEYVIATRRSPAVVEFGHEHQGNHSLRGSTRCGGVFTAKMEPTIST
jgi:hypothetical protein